jgi:single-strand DNA-binding protein
MASLNKIIIIGRVGKIESKDNNGSVIANFSVAVGNKYKNKQGESVESTEWFQCVAFQKLGEIISKYVEKGHLIYLEGSQKTEKYMDKTGVERTSVKLIVNNVQFLQQKDSNASPETQSKDYKYKDAMPFSDDILF